MHYVEEINSILGKLGVSEVHLLSGVNSDSKCAFKEATFEGISEYSVKKDLLYKELVEQRAIKTAKEVELLRYVNKVSSEAHKHVMSQVKPGMLEYQAETLFQHYCYFHGGCRGSAYTCICGSGENSAILHYGHSAAPNNRQISSGDMCLFDMGASYHGYVADITCSFPINGRFSEEQKKVYNAVLRASRTVLSLMKPGVPYTEMHITALRVICEDLKHAGLLRGSVDEMMEHWVGALFMPHGLGHLMGIDTHDCGGYSDGTERVQKPSIRSLRMGRKLKEGMCLTVEPGVYFIESLLTPAFDDPVYQRFLVREAIQPLLNFGGVRIEDDVVVTNDGVELLTQVPRTVEEIEEWMNKK